MINLRLARTVSRITLPELTFASKYALRVLPAETRLTVYRRRRVTSHAAASSFDNI